MTDDFGRCLEAAISAEIAGGGSSYVLAALARFRDAVRAANARVSAPAPVMESPSTKPVSDMSGAGAGVDLESAKVSDIHALIAAAKQTSHRDSHSMDKVLCDHAIAMAEALAMIAGYDRPLSQFELEAAFNDVQMIARAALLAIVKEANRDG